MPGSQAHRRAPGTSLRRALAVALVLVAAAPAALPSGAAGRGSPPTAHIARVQDQIVRCTNRARTAHGLRALRRNTVLGHAARYHAHNMLRYHFFRHDDVFGQTPMDRVDKFARRAAFAWVGENIAVGYWSAGDVCRAWMASSDHRANILNHHFTMIGVGYARAGDGRTYFVQDFASRH
jgi:uncharacterized protein YkwD